MAYNSDSYQSPISAPSRWTTWKKIITDNWITWKVAYKAAIDNYYNQRIEQFPEAEALAYWNRLKHPQSGIDGTAITDAMLSKLMGELLDQGVSKFAVDCFILELRRLRRIHRLT